MRDTNLDYVSPLAASSKNVDWLRYSAERAAAIGFLLVLASIATIAKHRAYRPLLGAAFVSATVAMSLAMFAHWRRPDSAVSELLAFCAATFASAITLAALSSQSLFPIDD